MSDLLGTAIGSFVIGLVVSFAVRAVVEWRHQRAKERWWRAWDNGHACGVECGSKDERAAIVEWLREPGNTVHTGAAMAAHIESGEHLRGDDE